MRGKLWLFGLILLLVSGCFQPATSPVEPTPAGGDAEDIEEENTPVLPATRTPPPGEDLPPGPVTLPAIVQTTTALAATVAATRADPSGPAALTPQDASTPDPNATAPAATLAATPTGSADVPAPTPTAPLLLDGCTHEVQPGENLFRLSLDWDTTVEAITELNDLPDPDNVAAGTVLRIPGCASGQPPANPPSGQPPLDGGQTYIVQAGDTLFSIAQRFGVSMQDIIDANPDLQENPDRLYAGQTIAIP